VPGQLVRVAVTEAQSVRAGEVLFEVEPQPARDALAQSRAAMAQAEAGLHNASAQAARARALLARGIVAQQEVDDAVTREAEGRAAVASARAAVAIAQRTVARSVVRAPFAGVITALHRHTGELVDGSVGTPVLELADPSSLELSAAVVPVDLVALREGQTATVRFEALGGAALPATVLAVSPALSATTGLGAVRLSLRAETLRPPLRLSGVAEVTVGQREGALLVPIAALRGGTEGSEVVVCDGEHARVHTVQTGVRTAQQVEIVEGVEAGAKVATEGLLGISDGAEIETGAE
jgi:RND family efflux transporter MFP subunit